jgi:hypothetical protein
MSKKLNGKAKQAARKKQHRGDRFGLHRGDGSQPPTPSDYLYEIKEFATGLIEKTANADYESSRFECHMSVPDVGKDGTLIPGEKYHRANLMTVTGRLFITVFNLTHTDVFEFIKIRDRFEKGITKRYGVNYTYESGERAGVKMRAKKVPQHTRVTSGLLDLIIAELNTIRIELKVA